MSDDARQRKAQKLAIKKKIMECVLADCKDLCKLKNEEIVKKIRQQVQSKRGEISKLIAKHF